MTKQSQKTEILESLQENEKLYRDISNQVLKLSEKTAYNKEIKNFASFIASVTNALVRKGYVELLLELDNVLMEKLSPRIGLDRFTQFDLNMNNENYFTEFTRDDEENKKRTSLNSIPDLKQHTENMHKLFDVDPLELEEKLPSKTNDNKQLEKYLIENVDALGQYYESFVLVTLYCVILVKSYLDISTEEDRKKLKDFKTDVIDNLYNNAKEIKELVAKVNLDENYKKELIAWYEAIYGTESIRELKNVKIHSNSENRIKFQDGLLQITYQNGTKKSYTLREIKDLKSNLQLSIFICFYLVANSFYYMLHELLTHENDESNK